MPFGDARFFFMIPPGFRIPFERPGGPSRTVWICRRRDILRLSIPSSPEGLADWLAACCLRAFALLFAGKTGKIAGYLVPEE
jgi:hypothetical protein